MTVDPQYCAFDAYGNECPATDLEYWTPIWAAEEAVKLRRLAERERERLWQENRKIVLAGNPVCAYCRVKPATCVDHMNPYGRVDEMSNYAPACLQCNSRKIKLTPYSWLQFLESGAKTRIGFPGADIHIPLTEEQHLRLAELIAQKYGAAA